MDEDTVLEAAETAVSGKRTQFWHRLGVDSAVMILGALLAFSLQLLLFAVLNHGAEPGLFSKCLGMAALTSFVVGTFLADLWMLHALLKGPGPGPAGGVAPRMNPVFSLLLTCRLRSEATESVEKDILSVKALLALFATVLSALLLFLLWTHK